MMPVMVTLSTAEYEAVVENLDLFAKSGFAVDDFGDGTVRVTECPTELADCDVGELVAEIADKLSSNTKNPEPKWFGIFLDIVLKLFFATCTVTAHELINATSCVNQFLFTCEEWVR